MSGAELQVGSPPRQVRLAGVLTGLQGVLGLLFAAAVLVKALGVGRLSAPLVAEVGFFLMIGGAVTAAGWGLYAGRRWAWTPAIVTQLLLLPVVYSLLGPSEQVLIGMVSLGYVVLTFMLLISESARIWSTGEDQDPAEPS